MCISPHCTGIESSQSQSGDKGAPVSAPLCGAAYSCPPLASHLHTNRPLTFLLFVLKPETASEHKTGGRTTLQQPAAGLETLGTVVAADSSCPGASKVVAGRQDDGKQKSAIFRMVSRSESSVKRIKRNATPPCPVRTSTLRTDHSEKDLHRTSSST